MWVRSIAMNKYRNNRREMQIFPHRGFDVWPGSGFFVLLREKSPLEGAFARQALPAPPG